MMRLRLLRLVIGLKISRQFFYQGEAKPNAPNRNNFSRALSKLQVIMRNSDWLIVLFAHAVIGQSNYFGVGNSLA